MAISYTTKLGHVFLLEHIVAQQLWASDCQRRGDWIIRWMMNNIRYPLTIQSLFSVLPTQGTYSPAPQWKHFPVTVFIFEICNILVMCNLPH